jgi:hypothetical protein
LIPVCKLFFNVVPLASVGLGVVKLAFPVIDVITVAMNATF